MTAKSVMRYHIRSIVHIIVERDVRMLLQVSYANSVFVANITMGLT